MFTVLAFACGKRIAAVTCHTQTYVSTIFRGKDTWTTRIKYFFYFLTVTGRSSAIALLEEIIDPV